MLNVVLGDSADKDSEDVHGGRALTSSPAASTQGNSLLSPSPVNSISITVKDANKGAKHMEEIFPGPPPRSSTGRKRVAGKARRLRTSVGSDPAAEHQRNLQPLQEELSKLREELKTEMSNVMDRLDTISAARIRRASIDTSRVDWRGSRPISVDGGRPRVQSSVSEGRRVQFRSKLSTEDQKTNPFGDDVSVGEVGDCAAAVPPLLEPLPENTKVLKSFVEGDILKENSSHRRTLMMGNDASWDNFKTRLRYMTSSRSGTTKSQDHLTFKTTTPVSLNLNPAQKIRFSVRQSVKSPLFECVSCFFILAHALVSGLQVDWQAKNLSDNFPTHFVTLEVSFCFVFMVELVLRLVAYPDFDPSVAPPGQMVYAKESSRVEIIGLETSRPVLAKGRWHWPWLLFDTVLLVSQVTELVMTHLAKVQGREDKSVSITAVRLLRVLRLLRALRLFRVLQMIHELRALTTSILSSIKSLAWALLLLLIIMYIFGMTLTAIANDHRISVEDKSTLEPALLSYWGSLGDSIHTLFQAITGGVDWGEAVKPLPMISPFLVFLFCLYVAFALLCILNIITGLFLDQALRTAKKERDSYMIHTLQNLFDSADFDHNGRITWEEFERLAATPSMRYVFEQIDLSHEEAETLFRLLDTHHRKSIDRDEFRSGCNSLRGPAKALDIAFLKKELLGLGARCDQQARYLEHHMPMLAELKSTLIDGKELTGRKEDLKRASQNTFIANGGNVAHVPRES